MNACFKSLVLQDKCKIEIFLSPAEGVIVLTIAKTVAKKGMKSLFYYPTQFYKIIVIQIKLMFSM